MKSHRSALIQQHVVICFTLSPEPQRAPPAEEDHDPPEQQLCRPPDSGLIVDLNTHTISPAQIKRDLFTLVDNFQSRMHPKYISYNENPPKQNPSASDLDFGTDSEY